MFFPVRLRSLAAFFGLLACCACASEAPTPPPPAGPTSALPLCLTGGPDSARSELRLVVIGDRAVRGTFNYLPAGRTPRIGRVSGAKSGDTLRLRYLYRRGNVPDTTDVTFLLGEPATAVAEDPGLELPAGFKVGCE